MERDKNAKLSTAYSKGAIVISLLQNPLKAIGNVELFLCIGSRSVGECSESPIKQQIGLCRPINFSLIIFLQDPSL